MTSEVRGKWLDNNRFGQVHRRFRNKVSPENSLERLRLAETEASQFLNKLWKAARN
jgi:hypothetical protein